MSVCATVLCIAAMADKMEKNMVNVKDFGAIGDGLYLDTRTIQNAINTGKIVYFPAGVYRTGTLYLKSGGGLHLSPHAVILGSKYPEDYNKDDFDRRNPVSSKEQVSGAHLIIARDCTDITISGSGTICGNRNGIFGTEIVHTPNGNRPRYVLPRWRPGAMLYFIGCKNIKLEGINLNDPTYWTAFFHDCENLSISGIMVKADLFTNNSDGLDIDCCRNVKVTNCTIFSGDDAIAIRGADRRLNKDAECSNVVVDNCILSSAACAVRLGVGSGTIRNCKLSNLQIVNSGIGIGICPSYSLGTCTRIDNVSFENISIKAVQALRMAPSWGSDIDDPAIKKVSNISFRNINAVSGRASVLVFPFKKEMFENISIKDSNFTINPDNSAIRDKHWTSPENGMINILGTTENILTNCKGYSPDNRPLVMQKMR